MTHSHPYRINPFTGEKVDDNCFLCINGNTGEVAHPFSLQAPTENIGLQTATDVLQTGCVERAKKL